MALTKIDDRGLKTPIDLLDNEKIRFGTGSDLEIYHNGSDSFVRDQGTGGLYLTGSVVGIRNSSANENGLLFTENGATELYYDNSMKVQTLSNGVRIEGDLKMNYADNHKIQLGAASDLQIYHDGSNSYIDETGTGSLLIRGDGLQLQRPNGNMYVKCVAGGTVELYHDNSKMFYTSASGCHVGSSSTAAHLHFLDSGIARFGTGNDLEIYHDGSHSRIVDAGTGDLKIQTNGLQLLNAAGDEYYLYAIENGSVSLYHNNVQKIETQSDGVTIGGHLRPWSSRDDTDDCGRPGQRWDDIYATNTTIQTSDRNEKEAITASDLGLAFVNKLTPVSFKRKGKTRTHYGLIAQDIETVLTNISKTTTQFAGFIKSDISEKQDGSSYRYGLRMGEFTAPLIKAVQELSAEVDTLKTKVAALEAK